MRLTVPSGGGAITQGGNSAAVLAALADGADETANPLFVASGLQGFNGATLDMIRALADNGDAVAVATLGRLAVIARNYGFNGTSYDRLRSEGTDRDAIAVETLGNLQTLGFLQGFNGASWDRLRTLGGTSLLGLGQLSVSPAVPGATTVLSTTLNSVSNATTRATVATPGSGLRIRMLSVEVSTTSGTRQEVEVYFGDGANQNSDITKAIARAVTIEPGAANFYRSWPDGGGPVGIADEVLSWRSDFNATTANSLVAHWREE